MPSDILALFNRVGNNIKLFSIDNNPYSSHYLDFNVTYDTSIYPQWL